MLQHLPQQALVYIHLYITYTFYILHTHVYITYTHIHIHTVRCVTRQELKQKISKISTEVIEHSQLSSELNFENCGECENFSKDSPKVKGLEGSTVTATHCNTLQHTATHCNTLQHTCNTLQQSALKSSDLTGLNSHFVGFSADFWRIWEFFTS